MKLLALDIATLCGWASPSASGVWDLKPKRGESDGMRVVRFRARFKEIIEAEDIDLVAYERPAGRFKASIMVASEMIGVLKAYCVEKDINYVAYSPKEIKKHATGNGNSGKPAMVEAAKRKFTPLDIIDDNHADALFLYDLTEKDLGL